MTHRSRFFCRPFCWATLPWLLTVFCFAGEGAEPRREVVNTFKADAEGWQVYDYNGGADGGGNAFYPVTWKKSGGVEDSGYVWADDSRWRIDTPEKPHSILAFIIYRVWVKAGELDLRDAELSVHLRGDKLDLKGAKCNFWAFDRENGTRWHFTGKPLKVSEGRWGERQTLVLKNDESLWHRSWSRNPEDPASLDHVLGSCDSYGFSFVGFSEEVTGKLSMDEFRIRLQPQPKRPQTGDVK